MSIPRFIEAPEIVTRVATKEYRDNWDAVFGKKCPDCGERVKDDPPHECQLAQAESKTTF